MEIEKDKHEWTILKGTERIPIVQEIFQSYTDIDSLLDGSTTKEKLKNMYDQITSEDIAERRARHREYERMYRASENPEQIAKRRAWNREYMRLKRASETPEEVAKRRARCREYNRQIRERRNKKKKTGRILNETKQAETTFANLNNKTIECSNGHERSRPPSRTMECDTEKHNSTELKKEQHKDEWSIFECTESNFVSQETFQSYTDVDSALDEFKTKEKLKNIYDQQKRAEITAKRRARWHQCRALETAEEAAVRRARRQVYNSLETPEQAEKRRAHNREYMRLKRAKETPEQIAKRRARCREYNRRLRSRQNKKKGKGQNLKDTERVELAFANLNPSTERSNGEVHSQPPSEIMESDIAKPDSTDIKKEYLQEDWATHECSENSLHFAHHTFQNNTDCNNLLNCSTIKETLQNKDADNQHARRNERQKRRRRKANEDNTVTIERLDYMKILLDVEAKRDNYSVYGEYIATRLRNCNKEESEISIAKQHLENILYNLNAGVYSCVTK